MDFSNIIMLFWFFVFIGFVFFILWICFRINNKKIDSNFVSDILDDDSSFDVNSFKKQVKRCIEDVFIAFSKCDINKLMVLESTELFNNHKSEIELGISNGSFETLFFNKFYNVDIVDYRVEGGFSIIACKIWVKTRKVKINAVSKEVITYDEAPTYHPMFFEFIRSINVKTVVGDEFDLKNCPNCGALLDISAQGKCVYCDSMIINGEHSWVLNKVDDLFYTK